MLLAAALMWFKLKLEPFHYLIPFARLRYNSATNQYSNTDGVDTLVPGFGNTSSIEYLDPTTPWLEPTQYFHDMVQHFVQLGYEPGKTIRGAPFDWRYSAGVWSFCYTLFMFYRASLIYHVSLLIYHALYLF